MLPASVCNVSSCTVHYNAIDNENKQVNIDDIGIVFIYSNIACQFQRQSYGLCKTMAYV